MMTRSAAAAVLAGLTFLALGTGTASGDGTSTRRYLYLQPLGQELPTEDVELVKRALVGFYQLELRVLPRAELPASAYYPPRRRYRADRILTFLEKRLPPDGYRILGLTAVDISTTKGRVYDWGILGLGGLNDSAAVISAFRCRLRSRSAAHARERLAKVAVHEIGHTLGLEHCPTRGCLMEDARGLVRTCDREFDVCPRCRALLKQWGRPIPEKADVPWPRP